MSIRHVCETSGCYIKEQTPDWGFTDSSFTGKIRIGDIDGIVEVNGHILILEWKGENVPIPFGQEMMFTKATRSPKITVFVVNGCAKESRVSNIKVFFGGKVSKDEPLSNDGLCEMCQKWEKHARSTA